MRIRLCGSPDEVAEATDVLRATLDVRDVSRPYPNRQGEGVRVYVRAELLSEGALYVTPPVSSPRLTSADETATAGDVEVTDRIMTSRGWQRVVRVEPPVVDELTEVRWIFTEPDTAPFCWVLLVDAPLRRRRFLPNPEERK